MPAPEGRAGTRSPQEVGLFFVIRRLRADSAAAVRAVRLVTATAAGPVVGVLALRANTATLEYRHSTSGRGQITKGIAGDGLRQPPGTHHGAVGPLRRGRALAVHRPHHDAGRDPPACPRRPVARLPEVVAEVPVDVARGSAGRRRHQVWLTRIRTEMGPDGVLLSGAACWPQ